MSRLAWNVVHTFVSPYVSMTRFTVKTLISIRVRARRAQSACRVGMFGFVAHKTGSKTVSTFLNRILAMRVSDQARHSLLFCHTEATLPC